MGYTHYWYVNPEIDRESFIKVVNDFTKLIEPLEHLGVPLGDGFGKNKSIITDTEINFNGRRDCGHKQRNLGITWPAPKASGVHTSSFQKSVDGQWFAGQQLSTRTCDGDCSHEGFILSQKQTVREEDLDDGKAFDCTKTAYKPYDLAVTACLVIAKHHLGDDIHISSDGESENWEDACKLCQQFLGYGQNFALDTGESI